MPIAYCLLPIAYCLLPIAFAYCLLPIDLIAYSSTPKAPPQSYHSNDIGLPGLSYGWWNYHRLSGVGHFRCILYQKLLPAAFCN